ncbi:hypothetical protein RCL1_002174 [Eukaryota sp. TZLM3-RCL]
MKSLIALVLCLAVLSSARLNQYHHDLHIKTMERYFGVSQASNGWLLFDQKVDHFDGTNTDTFKQRYCKFLSPSFSNGSPIFLYISGENRARDNLCSTGYSLELAKMYKGALFAVEHRFYGESYPYQDLTLPSLSLLSSRQALYDLATFAFSLKKSYPDSPIVIIGGSYSGVLSAIARQMFPHLFIGAWSSSGPILAKEDFYEYDRQVRLSLNEKCAKQIQIANAKLETLLENPMSKRPIKKRFRCENVTDDVDFLYIITDAVAFGVQYNYINQLCARMESSDALEGLIDYSTWLFDLLKTDPHEWSMTFHTSEEKEVQNGHRQWLYQSCREFGYWQTYDKENPLRSKRINIDYHRNVCKVLYKRAFIPDTDDTNMAFGEYKFAGTNVAFSNGALDPWKNLGLVPSKLSKEQELRGCTSIEIPGAAHCEDLHTPSPQDSDHLVKARQFMTGEVNKWLNEYYSR